MAASGETALPIIFKLGTGPEDSEETRARIADMKEILAMLRERCDTVQVSQAVRKLGGQPTGSARSENEYAPPEAFPSKEEARAAIQMVINLVGKFNDGDRLSLQRKKALVNELVREAGTFKIMDLKVPTIFVESNSPGKKGRKPAVERIYPTYTFVGR